MTTTDPIRAALAELVALKDLKLRISTLAYEQGDAAPEVVSLQDEYDRRKPAAWAAARVELSTAERKDGYALVPRRPTQEMGRVMDSENWQWPDLLAAAEAITQEEYVALSSPETTVLTDERIHELADSAECNRDHGWGPKWSYLTFARAVEREVRGPAWLDVEMVEACARKIEGNHLVKGSPGPLFSMGWIHALEWAAKTVRKDLAAAPATIASLTRKVERSFTNELGNLIRIVVEGPVSTHENIVTPLEAGMLRESLNEFASQPISTVSATQETPAHVCGLQGFNPYEGDECPACAVRDKTPTAGGAPLPESEIDLIANDGMRNAAGGIYATRVYDFARAIEAAHGITQPAGEPL